MNLKEFRAAIGRKDTIAPGAALLRFTAAEAPSVDGEARVATFVFSDNSVDRYGDTIDARGWVLDKFVANPVALFGHDSNSVENVIGKARNVRVDGQRLVGEIEFMEASVNPNAEAVYQMVKGGYLNAVSVGFAPIDWAPTKDKSRPGGVDFKKQELLEISIVPIPANPAALVQARAAGIDVDRLGLIASASEEPPADLAKRRSALLVRKVLGRRTKGLYDLGCLAGLLSELGMLTDWSAWEAEMEGDGSNVPDMLVSILFDLADAFMAMAQEEVSEFLSTYTEEPDLIGMAEADVNYVKQGKSVAARCFRAGRIKMRDIGVVKAGKVISADTEKKVRDAHGHMTQACDILMGLVEPSADVEEKEIVPEAVASDPDKELRVRRAQAMKLRLEIDNSAAA
ncbi:HK97 family phage prohead protease [Bradyrhizobium elkanii]|uniref:HK97 family phage prohead protease n=1 Tax=Bradyrhizobium elkanii TaxID=29448 RepID=UPI0035161FDA